MVKELIDKIKIHNIAVELAGEGKLFCRNTDERMQGLSFEEQTMLIAFMYTELLFNDGMIPKATRNQMLRVINTQVQNYARDFQQYKEFSAREIKLVRKTELKRVELAKALNIFDDEKALQLALQLIDIYQFGIAESHIYEDIYLNRESKGV